MDTIRTLSRNARPMNGLKHAETIPNERSVTVGNLAGSSPLTCCTLQRRRRKHTSCRATFVVLDGSRRGRELYPSDPFGPSSSPPVARNSSSNRAAPADGPFACTQDSSCELVAHCMSSAVASGGSGLIRGSCAITDSGDSFSEINSSCESNGTYSCSHGTSIYSVERGC